MFYIGRDYKKIFIWYGRSNLLLLKKKNYIKQNFEKLFFNIKKKLVKQKNFFLSFMIICKFKFQVKWRCCIVKINFIHFGNDRQSYCAFGTTWERLQTATV